jgi:penicillin amidase/acyl-homoserine-lactone acylase
VAPVWAEPEPEVQILRDTWGVPHVFGKTDADTAYGLAYAHCEDDFKTIQETLVSGRSLLASVNGADAAPVDFMVHLLGVWDDVNAKYETDLSPETRAICEAYAAGVNRYAEAHAEELLVPDVFPVTGKDIVVGFVFKAPFFFGLDNAVMELFGKERRREISEKHAQLDFDEADAFQLAGHFLKEALPTGSNTFGVSRARTADGGTYLAVNSHQPYTGPVAWYEAHLHSEEGWNMYGGLFPGMPVIGHGYNPDLGWAMTVNSPDLVDIYVLEMNPDNPNQYRFDGEWRDLDTKEVTLQVRINPNSKMTMKVRREVARSVHGPVVRTDHGVYAIRYAGMGDIRQVEQWYRMNKARSREEWLDAVRMQAIASLNIGYADAEGNIAYLYNARIPVRTEGYDYELYLPGNTSETLWTEYLPFDDLPTVVNPPSGFFQNCNSTPFQTTTGPGNPDPVDYSTTAGIETHMTNRAMRAIELFGGDESITWDEFVKYKYDTRYSKDSVVAKSVAALIDYAEESPGKLDEEGIALLNAWDLNTDPDNRSAALGVMTVVPATHGNGTDVPPLGKLIETYTEAVKTLREKHGRLDVPWSTVNRLVRGSVDLGIGGAPDVLHAVYGGLDADTGRYIARAGDTLVLLVRWDKGGKASSRVIHQFGSATLDETSPHYADQSPLFVACETRPVWMTEDEIRVHLEREYRPGHE